MLFISIRMMDSGTFFHSAWRRHVSSFPDFRRLQPLIRQSNSSQKFFIGFNFGFWAGQSSRFTPLSSYYQSMVDFAT
ncbi:unnamed protein product [Larinioides sclopetarius]|uniref:Uncharacterized protein n=1 Tax=Larinioides sclopetarius TaxID=280406 RepID=A0AAV2B2M4_9ARAC